MEHPIFEFVLNDQSEHFTTAIVKDPAIESTLMYFDAETEKPTFFANEEKRIIYAVAMQPNKMIFRKATDTLPAHYGFFSADTIEKFQENYQKFNGNAKTNINHSDTPIDGVFRLENWIVANSEIDKSKAIGLQDVKDGSLVMAFKVENNDVWQECKNGNLDGLSIEASLGRKETSTNFNKNNMNVEKTPQKLWDAMKAFFAAETPAVPATETDAEKAKRLADEAAAKEAGMAADTGVPTPVENPADMQKEVDDLKKQLADLQAKVADMEAKEVQEDAAMVTMKAEKEAAVIALAVFKAETPATVAVKDMPREDFSSERNEGLEKFKKQHLKK